MIHLAGRRIVWAALMVAAAIAGKPSLAVSQQDQDLIELLLEIRIDRGPSRDVIALVDDTRLLVPLTDFLEMAEIGVQQVQVGHRLTGILYPARDRFVFDTDSSIVAVGTQQVAIEPGHTVWRGEELYVEREIIESTFSIQMQINLAELMLAVWNSDHLPVIQRLSRERRRVRLRPEEEEHAAALYRVRQSPVDGAVFDWAVTSATDDPSRFTGIEVGLGAQVFGGSGILLHEERRNEGMSTRRTTGSWTRVWHTSPWLRQVRLGEVLGSGARAQIVQGATITNSPFVRPAAFDIAALRGMFGPGWEVELYRGNQYLGFVTTDATGQYRFDVPTRYGENPLDIIGYGPRGQVLRQRRTFEIDAARFPAKQFEYGISGGACPFAPCDAQANLDLRYGLNNKLTVRGGVDRFWRDTLPDLWHPYASLAYQATRGLSLFAEAVGNALVAGQIDYAPSQDFNAGFSHTRFIGDVDEPILGSSGLTDLSQATLLYRPSLWNYRTFVRLIGQRTAGGSRTRELGRATVTARFGGARLDLGATYDRVRVEPTFEQARTTFEARYFHTYGGSLAWLRRTLLFAEVGVAPDTGLTLARAGFSRTFGGRLQLDMAGGWGERFGWMFELGLTATLHAVRAVANTQFNEDGTQGILVAEGSVLWDRNGGRVEFSDGRSLGRAGIAGEVFLDVDGDGLPGPDEPRVSGVYVSVGPIATHTNASGRFAVWDLVAFEPIVVQIDVHSIPNPLWMPVENQFTFRPDPNAFSLVPVPLVQAGEVSGAVVVGPRDVGARFLEVEFRSLDTDDSYTVTTFSDGSFYLLGVRPGRYEATISQDLLDELGLSVQPAPFTVGTSMDQAFIEGIIVRLVER